MDKTMNKKMTTLMLGIATVLLASCSQNEDVLQTGTDGTLQAVTITATTGGSMTTRSANAQGDNEVTRCLIQIFEKEGQELQPMEGYETPKSMTGSETDGFNTTATLNPTKKYSILFWADNGESSYDETAGLQAVKVTGDAMPSIAYAGKAEWTSTSGASVNINLKHAVAKVTLRSTTAVSADKQLSLTIPGMYAEYDVSSGTVSGSATSKTYAYTVPTGGVAANGDVFSCYALVDGNTQNLTLSAISEKVSITNVPLASNKHTILKGDVGSLGLETVTFTCTIDAAWGSEETQTLIPSDAVKITSDNSTISDDGNYVVSGTFNNQITVIGGSPTIYLKDANINVSSSNAINITSGNPTIHVVGVNNTVSSSDGAGIYIAPTNTVTIQGGSQEDKLTVTAGGGKNASGIGGYNDGSSEMSCGNIEICNITLTAYANRSGLDGTMCPGIGGIENCGDIYIRNATVTARGTAEATNSACAIGAKNLPKIVISNSEIHAYRGSYDNNCYGDYIGQSGDVMTAAKGDIQGSITGTIVHKYTYDWLYYSSSDDGSVEIDGSSEGKEQ